MTTPAPSFFSLEFHLRFFPAVLWRRLRSAANADANRPSFSNHIPIEMPLMVAGCIVLLVIGVPLAFGVRPFLGGALALLGLGGAIFLVVHSIGSRPWSRPSYDTFHVMVFLFCVLLGLTAGLLLADSRLGKIAGGAGGALAGYCLGVPAGRWIECLGWIVFVPDLLAGIGSAGLAIFDAFFARY